MGTLEQDQLFPRVLSNTTLQPTSGALRLRILAGWRSRRSRLSVEPLGGRKDPTGP